MTIAVGASFAFLAVVAGAFGAHALEKIFDAYSLKIWHTAVTYHMTHALALVALGIFERQIGRALNWPFGLFVAGIVIFSGSLYLLAFTGVKVLGAITPIGGAFFLAGWACLAWAAWKSA